MSAFEKLDSLLNANCVDCQDFEEDKLVRISKHTLSEYPFQIGRMKNLMFQVVCL